MLCAYYDRTCDSEALFHDLTIADEDDYKQYLNQYDLIYIDITEFLNTLDRQNAVHDILEKVADEIRKDYPQINDDMNLSDTLLQAAKIHGRPFIFIIDEWGRNILGSER